MEERFFDRFERFTVLVNRILRSIHRIKSNETSKLGLKSTHVTCLYYLLREGGKLTAKELCDVCGEDKAAVSRAIDDLEKNGLVACECKAEKRYRSPIVLTAEGEKSSREISARVDEVLKTASDGLSEEMRSVLYESLNIISDNLMKICKE